MGSTHLILRRPLTRLSSSFFSLLQKPLLRNILATSSSSSASAK